MNFERDASAGPGGTAAGGDAEVQALYEKLESLAAVPELFEATVREFAGWLELDADALMRGEAFEVGEVEFVLMHYGPLDPGGATVAVNYGEFSVDNEADLWRQLLEHNMQTAAGMHGFFGLLPQHPHIYYCVRVDLEHAEEPAARLGTVVGMAADSIKALREGLARQVAAMREVA